MKLVLVSGPDNEPVDLIEAKVHLRVDVEDDDDLIEGLITAARQHIELVTQRALITQTWEYVLDAFPAAEIRLPRPPLQLVGSIVYKLEDGTEVTLDPSTHIVDTKAEPGLIVPAVGETWPTDTLYPTGAITIEYDAGYGDIAADVPMGLRQAILLIVGHWYENRESVVVGQTANVVPFAAEALICPYRTWWWQT